MEVSSHNLPDIDSFIFYDSILFHEKDHYLDEWEGEIIYETHTDIFTEYSLYFNPYNDLFFIYKNEERIEYDLRKYYFNHPLKEEHEEFIFLKDIKEENMIHFKKIFECVRRYLNRQDNLKNRLYYELMEKTMDPNRLEWIF
jgi:hypothetical protein